MYAELCREWPLLNQDWKDTLQKAKTKVKVTPEQKKQALLEFLATEKRVPTGMLVCNDAENVIIEMECDFF